MLQIHCTTTNHQHHRPNTHRFSHYDASLQITAQNCIYIGCSIGMLSLYSVVNIFLSESQYKSLKIILSNTCYSTFVYQTKIPPPIFLFSMSPLSHQTDDTYAPSFHNGIATIRPLSGYGRNRCLQDVPTGFVTTT